MKRETWLELGGTPLGFSACSSCPLHALTVLIAWAALRSRALLDPKEQVVQWSIDCESAFSRTLIWSLELQNCIKHRPRSHGLLCSRGPLCSHRLLYSHRSVNHRPLCSHMPLRSYKPLYSLLLHGDCKGIPPMWAEDDKKPLSRFSEDCSHGPEHPHSRLREFERSQGLVPIGTKW